MNRFLKLAEGLGAISYVGEKFKVLKLRHSSGRGMI